MTQGYCLIGNQVTGQHQAPLVAMWFATEPVITYHSNGADEAFWGYAYTSFNNGPSFVDGSYTITQTDQASCSLAPPTYDCSSGSCVVNSSGTGLYSSLASCQASCAWYDCINNACTSNLIYSTPGNYKSLAACTAACGGTNCPTGRTCCPVGQSCFDPNDLPCPTCPDCPSCPACPACPACPDCFCPGACAGCPDSTGKCPDCPACPNTAASCPHGQTCQLPSGEDVNFVNISVPTFLGTCDSSGNPKMGTKTVSVIAGTEVGENLKFQELAEIQGAAVCQLDVGVVPDGWLIRPEYHRPQVIYQFAEVDDSGNITGAPKYKITVPHHVADAPDTALPNYQRGNWEIIYVLDDNSKITIHSYDEDNGMTMLNAIKLRLDSNFTSNAYLSKSSLVVTTNEIAQINVKNRMAKYYSTGAKNELPDWIKKW